MANKDLDEGKTPYRRGLATIYDVAREAKVSSQTVSRYFNGYKGIRPITREKVERAAAALNYRPNLTARLLTTNQSRRIGAFTHEISAIGGGSIIAGASRAASQAGYLLDIVSLDVKDERSIDRAILSIGQHELAGVVAFAPTDDLIRAFADAEFAVPVIIDSDDDDGMHDGLRSTDGLSEAAVVRYLASLGHTSMGHLAGPEGWVSARNRLLGFERGLAEHRLQPTITIKGDWTAKSGWDASARFIKSDVTAIVVASDQMAFGLMRGLADQGISVPGDISVVGFDNLGESQYFSPSLTTLHQDFEGHGRSAVERLLGLLQSRERRATTTTPLRLIERESSAPPRRRGN